MNKSAIFPLIYIVVWFYWLFTFTIPTLSIHLGDFLSLSLWQIVGTILFFVPCTFPILIFAVFGFIALLLAQRGCQA